MCVLSLEGERDWEEKMSKYLMGIHLHMITSSSFKPYKEGVIPILEMKETKDQKG